MAVLTAEFDAARYNKIFVLGFGGESFIMLARYSFHSLSTLDCLALHWNNIEHWRVFKKVSFFVVLLSLLSIYLMLQLSSKFLYVPYKPWFLHFYERFDFVGVSLDAFGRYQTSQNFVFCNSKNILFGVET